MGEEVKKNESWDARWLTIPEFADAVPLNLFHKEQVQPSVEDIKTAEFQNVHVFVRGHFTLERAQKIFCKVTADDHYKAYLDGAFMGKDLPRHIIRSIITMFWNWGHLLPGSMCWHSICIIRDL